MMCSFRRFLSYRFVSTNAKTLPLTKGRAGFLRATRVGQGGSALGLADQDGRFRVVVGRVDQHGRVDLAAVPCERVAVPFKLGPCVVFAVAFHECSCGLGMLVHWRDALLAVQVEVPLAGVLLVGRGAEDGYLYLVAWRQEVRITDGESATLAVAVERLLNLAARAARYDVHRLEGKLQAAICVLEGDVQMMLTRVDLGSVHCVSSRVDCGLVKN